MASHVVLIEQLLEMGFEEKLIHGALKLLKENATLESVIEAIDNGSAAEAAEKINDEDDQKSKQEKVLTPEELEAKKKDYEEKLKKRRAEIEEKEKEANRLRELQRRKDGKDMGKLREELEKMQHENYIQSLQKEREEAKAARDKILKQIELDKAERRARFATTTTDVSSATKPIANLATLSTSKSTGKTKLAVRMFDGSQLVQEFDDKEVLSAVRAYIVTQKNYDFNITFAMPPRPPFSEEDMDKSLFSLGLSPNARLQVIKR